MDDEYLSQSLTQPTNMPTYSRKRKYAPKKYTTSSKKRRTFVKRRRFGTRPVGKSSRFVRRIALSLAENKCVRNASKIANASSFNHDTAYVYSLHDSNSDAGITRISQNTGDSARTGSDIYSVGIRVRGMFTLPYDRRNTTIKMYLVESNSSQGSLPADLFRSTTGNRMLDPINTDNFKGVKLLRVLRTKARDLYVERGELTDAGSEATIHYNIWIPFKRHLVYNSSSAVCPKQGVKEMLSIVMIPYDTPSTSTTDTVITSHEQYTEMYYKDP